MLKCNVCSHEFSASAEKHYVARNNHTLFGGEEILYDAFDCPVCGCQIII